MAAAGPDLLTECSMAETCKTGEASVTKGCALPASCAACRPAPDPLPPPMGPAVRRRRFIIHSVGPRYNERYRTAAENALHSCYRNSMRLLKEEGLRTIAFPPLYAPRKGYPRVDAAHIALRACSPAVRPLRLLLAHLLPPSLTFCPPRPRQAPCGGFWSTMGTALTSRSSSPRARPTTAPTNASSPSTSPARSRSRWRRRASSRLTRVRPPPSTSYPPTHPPLHAARTAQGNKHGETVIANRQIRIAPLPGAGPGAGAEGVGPSADAGAATPAGEALEEGDSSRPSVAALYEAEAEAAALARDEDEDGEAGASRIGAAVGAGSTPVGADGFNAMHGDQDAARLRALEARRSALPVDKREEEEVNRLYARYLRRAKEEDLTDIAALNLLYQSGAGSPCLPLLAAPSPSPVLNPARRRHRPGGSPHPGLRGAEPAHAGRGPGPRPPLHAARSGPHRVHRLRHALPPHGRRQRERPRLVMAPQGALHLQPQVRSRPLLPQRPAPSTNAVNPPLPGTRRT